MIRIMNKNNREFIPLKTNSLIMKIIVRFFFFPIIFGLIVLFPAGTFNYWQFYVYIAVIVAPMLLVLLYFYKNDQQFIERRLKVQEKEKQQKIIQIIFSIIFFTGFVISGFDKRFDWSTISVEVVLLANCFIFFGYLIVFFVFRQNRFASRIIEVEKGQEVISTGLYGIVRHPMYIGVLIMFIPTPIALGSYWGLIPMATMPLSIVLRILNEEKVLCRDLPGYTEYCQKTRYRLIPFIW